MLDDLRILNIDETMTTHENVNNLMDLIETLSTLGEEMPPQNS